MKAITVILLIASLIFILYILTPPVLTRISYVRLQASLAAESGLHYALTKIKNSPWLVDLPISGFQESIKLETGRYKNVTSGNRSFRLGHYLHREGQDPLEVADVISNEGQIDLIQHKLLIPTGCKLSVWAEPAEYTEQGCPAWNDKWKIMSEATIDSLSVTRMIKIKAKPIHLPYIIMAARMIKLDSFQPVTIEGALWSNGWIEIGPQVAVDSTHIETVALGCIQIHGAMIGRISASSIKYSINDSPVFQNNKDDNRNVELRTGYEMCYDSFGESSNLMNFYKIASIWSGGSPYNRKINLYPQCRLPPAFADLNYADIDSYADCVECLGGIWLDFLAIPDYPALAATEEGMISPEALDIAFKLSATQDGASPDEEVISIEEGMPLVYMPHRNPPDEKFNLKKDLPILDWEYLRLLAMESPETKRSQKTGTVFDSWEQFSEYILNPSYDLVEHIPATVSGAKMLIRIGQYDSQTGKPLEPIVIYICKLAQDEGMPNRGFFCVENLQAALEINGSIISENGVDLRDYDPNQKNPGRYRDYTSGKDGRIVVCCGGNPARRADALGACDEYGIYSWVKDGVQELTIRGFPGAPALASLGDLWIIGRRFKTRVYGGIFAPNGHILINSPSTATQEPYVEIYGKIAGKDVEIRNAYLIRDDHPEGKGSFYKNIFFTDYEIVENTANLD